MRIVALALAGALALAAQAAQISIPAGAKLQAAGGTINSGCSDVLIAGQVTATTQMPAIHNLTISSGGTFSLSAATASLGGNWSNSGTFTNNGNSTVAFVDQCATGNATLTGTTNFFNLTFSSLTGRTFTIPVGLATNVAGTLFLSGTSGSPIQLLSANPAQAARIVTGPSATVSGSNYQLGTNVSIGPATFTLTVTKAGSGTGGVTSSPAGINCPGTCTFDYASLTPVTLTATPTGGSTFAGWSGACTGTGTCQVTMDAARSVTATFDPPSTGQSADVAITQSANLNPASAAKDVIITLTATNNGPAAATGVTVTNPIPSGAAYVWTTLGSCALASGTVTCNVASLASGASASFKLVVRPAAAGSITNVVSVAAAQSDPSSSNNTSSLTLTVNASPAGIPVQRYRLYSDVTKEHHFTTDLNEYNVLGTYVGTWVQEGGVGKILNNPGSFNGVIAVPYYRLYDNSTRWHHWTTDANEYYTLGFVYSGWNMEGVDGYILPTITTGATQLYRLNYPALGSLHHWTIDSNEYTTLINVYGWVGEGGSGFVVQ